MDMCICLYKEREREGGKLNNIPKTATYMFLFRRLSFPLGCSQLELDSCGGIFMNHSGGLHAYVYIHTHINIYIYIYIYIYISIN